MKPTPATPASEPEVVEEEIRCCYRVQSSSRKGEQHFVDLTANSGLGSCTCEAHLFRCQPAIDRGGQFEDSKTFCRHVRLARAFFTKQTLIGIARMETEKKTK